MSRYRHRREVRRYSRWSTLLVVTIGFGVLLVGYVLGLVTQ